MRKKLIIIWAEQFSLIALMIIFFKILIKSPKCFDLFDSYFTILPLFILKNFNRNFLVGFNTPTFRLKFLVSQKSAKKESVRFIPRSLGWGRTLSADLS